MPKCGLIKVCHGVEVCVSCGYVYVCPSLFRSSYPNVAQGDDVRRIVRQCYKACMESLSRIAGQTLFYGLIEVDVGEAMPSQLPDDYELLANCTEENKHPAFSLEESLLPFFGKADRQDDKG